MKIEKIENILEYSSLRAGEDGCGPGEDHNCKDIKDILNHEN